MVCLPLSWTLVSEIINQTTVSNVKSLRLDSVDSSPSGRGAAWLARQSGGLEVPSSNLGAPTPTSRRKCGGARRAARRRQSIRALRAPPRSTRPPHGRSSVRLAPPRAIERMACLSSTGGRPDTSACSPSRRDRREAGGSARAPHGAGDLDVRMPKSSRPGARWCPRCRISKAVPAASGPAWEPAMCAVVRRAAGEALACHAGELRPSRWLIRAGPEAAHTALAILLLGHQAGLPWIDLAVRTPDQRRRLSLQDRTIRRRCPS